MINKILQFLYCLLFLLTPLIMLPNTSELFEFNKMLFIYLITVLIAFFWLLKMIFAKKIIFNKTPLDAAIFLFLLSQVLSTVFSIDRHTSLFGYYGRFNGGLLSILSYIILFYGFVSNQVDFKKILKISLLSSILVILWGLPGKFGHDLTCLIFMKRFDNLCWSTETNVFNPAERMFSTLGQPNWLGAYLAINFFIGIYFLINQYQISKIKNIYLPAIYLLLNFLTILFTKSRSALISVVIGLLIFFVYRYFSLIKKILIKYKFFLLLICIIFLFSIFYFRNYFPISNNHSPTSNPSVTESLDIRKIVWKGAIDLGRKYPLFGTGVETFAYSYYFVRPKEHNLTSEWDFIYNKAHNEYLNYLATTGFIGLGSYLLLIFSFIYYSLKISNFKFQISNQFQNPKYPFLLLAWLTILITNFFGFSTTTINLFFYLIPAFIVSLRGTSEASDEAISSKNLNVYQWGVLFLLLSSTLYLLFSISIYWLADSYYAKALQYLNPQSNSYQQAVYDLERAYSLRKEPVYADRLSTALAYLSVLASYQKEKEIAKKLVTTSQYYNEMSLKSSPANILYWKTKVKNQLLFYQSTLDKKELHKGIESLNQAVKLSPNDPKLFYYLSFFYQTLVLEDQALRNINRSIELKPNYQEAIDFKTELLKKVKD
ncbi:hypothetical protein COY88_03595 [Candidatus Roizmanbacteria bacterium CG_4_10_14_0_8_um_filter_35_28]|uniref:O-antigen ligase-related domain-containing protein n=1 Tax=Candidatus Roizmanbacteria bacterium CG_4_10_14_0_8_um_filter_35_28 TaxID=1974827 RepID=A0A2M7QFN2_9BACT|nr:MAG: hypothetical protein COY88_03595 [Candidatus Roizmanbacteria bacterium CG_4_10_14_0_8_um_filter_35_28]